MGARSTCPTLAHPTAVPLAGSRCGWRPLRLIRYKPSQLWFHHPTVQTTRARARALSSALRLIAGPNPTFLQLPPPLWKHHPSFSAACAALHAVTRNDCTQPKAAGGSLVSCGLVCILCSVGTGTTGEPGAGRRGTHTLSTCMQTCSLRLITPAGAMMLRRPAALTAGIRRRVLEHRRQDMSSPRAGQLGDLDNPDTALSHCDMPSPPFLVPPSCTVPRHIILNAYHQYSTAMLAVGMACLEPGMMSGRYLPHCRPAGLYMPRPMLSHPVLFTDGEVWSRVPRDLHPESEMECLDEVTCRGISCPPRPTYKYHFLFSPLSPFLMSLSLLSVPQAELLSRPSTVFLCLFFSSSPAQLLQPPFITTCNQSVAGRHPTKPSQDAVLNPDPCHSLRRCYCGTSQGRGGL